MEISLGDWRFRIDPEATWEYTHKCSQDHCRCPYCTNFYENVDMDFPTLRPVLSHMGIYLDGPCEVMPVEPTLIFVCYRITGQILRKGDALLHVDRVDLRPEEGDNTTFLLWAGPMELPWTQTVDRNEVVSPANQPEFLERMMNQLLRWADQSPTQS